jgi:hypothetical protein
VRVQQQFWPGFFPLGFERGGGGSCCERRWPQRTRPDDELMGRRTMKKDCQSFDDDLQIEFFVSRCDGSI